MNIDKNKFEVYNENEILNNISLNDCVLYATTNNYKGFTHNENRNICFINKDTDLDNRINNKYKNYKVKSYNKIKSTIDLTQDQDQSNPYNYFNETNNKKFISKKNIQESNISNIEDCMNTCLNNYDECKSITYLENPTQCKFYNNVKMKDHSKVNYDNDTYTLKKNINYSDFIHSEMKKNNSKYFDIHSESNNVEEENSIPLYNCNGSYSTNPFCTKEYTNKDLETHQKTILNNKYKNYSECFNMNNINTVQEEKDTYNDQCKKKFGNEYMYDNDIYNNNNKINCKQENEIKIKCKINLFNNDIINDNTFDSKKIIEHFDKANYEVTRSNSNRSIISMNPIPIMDYLPIFVSVFIIMLIILLNIR